MQHTPPTASYPLTRLLIYTPCCQMQCHFVLCSCIQAFHYKIPCWGEKQSALCILPHTLDLMGHTRSCTHSAFSLSIHPSHMYVDCICTNACNTEDVSHLPGLRSWLIISSLNSPVEESNPSLMVMLLGGIGNQLPACTYVRTVAIQVMYSKIWR